MAVHLADPVRRFLIEEIGSVERLDLLLFLHRYEAKWWAAQMLTGELNMPANAVQSHLEHLSSRNLLDVRLAESVIYRYKPGREELAQLVEEISRVHYHHRDEVVTVLARPASDSARLFAEAFHLRKGRHDG